MIDDAELTPLLVQTGITLARTNLDRLGIVSTAPVLLHTQLQQEIAMTCRAFLATLDAAGYAVVRKDVQDAQG